jgi:hypothetical protein
LCIPFLVGFSGRCSTITGTTMAGNIKKERESLIANPLDLLFISGRGERI